MKIPVKIEVDDREPRQMIKKLEKLEVTVERKRLKVGDYIFNDICIERKSVDDFCGSIVDGRLNKQVKNMKENFKKVCILVSGSIDKRWNKNFNTHSILGKIAGLVMDDNVNVILLDNDLQVAYLIQRMAMKSTLDKEKQNI